MARAILAVAPPAAEEKIDAAGARFTGIFDPESGGGQPLSILLRQIQDHERPVAFISSFGARPLTAAVYARGRNPAVSCFQRTDGSFVVIDGEIYKWDDAGTPVDTGAMKEAAGQTLLNRLLIEGPAALREIDAAAAFVFWDARRGRLSLCRDRSGIVPVFWTRQGSTLLWASHMECFRAFNVARRPNLAALDFFLAAACFPSPWTALAGINKVPPAHAVSWDGQGEPVCEAYWRPTGKPKLDLTVE
jgi:asparagine synthetase B (glutamine-hydrolysing)